jgi:hypothetical protein
LGDRLEENFGKLNKLMANNNEEINHYNEKRMREVETTLTAQITKLRVTIEYFILRIG